MKRLTTLILSLSVLLACVGCSGVDLVSVRIAYVNRSSSDSPPSSCISYETRRIAETSETRLYRLALQMAADAPESGGLYSVFPAGVRINSVETEDGIVTVDFGGDYSTLSGIQRTLADYCAAMTLCSFDGVDGVSITVGGEGDGRVLYPTDIVNSSAELRLRPYDIMLYYPYVHSGSLIGVDTELYVSDSKEPAEEAMRMLMRGRSTGSSTIYFFSKSVRLLSVTVQNRICYVDLSENILKSCEYNDGGANLTAYAIINTLCQFSYIDKVQLMSDGRPAGLALGLGSDEPLAQNSSLLP